MKLKQLVDRFKWEDIKGRFLKLYPDQKKNFNAHENVLNKLKKLKPKNSILLLDIDYSVDGLGDEKDWESWWNVSGYNTKESVYYAIEFTSWQEWLGMDIRRETLRRLPDKDILVHSLFEMTFCGYSQQPIQRKINTMRKIVKNEIGKKD